MCVYEKERKIEESKSPCSNTKKRNRSVLFLPYNFFLCFSLLCCHIHIVVLCSVLYGSSRGGKRERKEIEEDELNE